MLIYSPLYAELETVRYGHTWLTHQNFNFRDIADINITDTKIIITARNNTFHQDMVTFLAGSWPYNIGNPGSLLIGNLMSTTPGDDGHVVAVYKIGCVSALYDYIKRYQSTINPADYPIK